MKRVSRRVKRLWQVMADNGCLTPDGTALSTREILNLKGQPFTMNQLSNHLAGKPRLFKREDNVRVQQITGEATYPMATWLARHDAFEDDNS